MYGKKNKETSLGWNQAKKRNKIWNSKYKNRSVPDTTMTDKIRFEDTGYWNMCKDRGEDIWVHNQLHKVSARNVFDVALFACHIHYITTSWLIAKQHSFRGINKVSPDCLPGLVIRIWFCVEGVFNAFLGWWLISPADEIHSIGHLDIVRELVLSTHRVHRLRWI